MSDQEPDDEDDGNSALAKEFKIHYNSVQKEIKVKLKEAWDALTAAEEISEKHGVPFSSNISFIHNHFIPKSFSKSKFKALDAEVVSDISNIYIDYIEDYLSYGGWVHSAVC